MGHTLEQKKQHSIFPLFRNWGRILWEEMVIIRLWVWNLSVHEVISFILEKIMEWKIKLYTTFYRCCKTLGFLAMYFAKILNHREGIFFLTSDISLQVPQLKYHYFLSSNSLKCCSLVR